VQHVVDYEIDIDAAVVEVAAFQVEKG